MKKYIFFYFVLIIFIKTKENYNIKVRETQVDCAAIKDCFECSYNAEDCYWKSGTCIKRNEQYNEKRVWWKDFENCTDFASRQITFKYCGSQEYTYLSSNEDLTFQLKEVNFKYGREYLYCNYRFVNVYKYSLLKVKAENFFPKKTVAGIYVRKGDRDAYQWIRATTLKDTLENMDEVDFHFFTMDTFDKSPFSFKISLGKRKKIALYIGMGAVVLGCIICVLSITFVVKRILDSRKASLRIMEEYQRATGQRMVVISTANEEDLQKKKIDSLFQNELKPKEYHKVETQNDGKCTICFEDFTEKCMVSVTQCHHIFHYECLSKWLHENFRNPKCPNCNFHLIDSGNSPDNQMLSLNNREASLRGRRNYQIVVQRESRRGEIQPSYMTTSNDPRSTRPAITTNNDS